ncbi:MAG: N-acetylglucosamine-6-phosphate deacetylase [Cypionkella sp.]|uniref:N-acetylglucosamine-6-phosphate deacetylase n=1 Tax=Cypionkella sp. TaxID=2811411 RepID=UPI00260B34C2|nr:amidohydrolase family protein [Cypionkella sp.]MDB5659426.1 N-acetylglucosamine-6-phosphate deacetylase [Cypionkella sp.]
MISGLSHSPEANILTPAGWMRGRIVLDGPKIGAIAAKPCLRTEDNDLPLIIPGFIDLHIHGGNGTDYTDGEEGIRAFIRYHTQHGTVALAPTTSTAPISVIEAALADISHIQAKPAPNEATVLGAHLEGPFINPGKLGAQSNQTILPDLDLVARWTKLCRLRVATIAPEMTGGMELISAFSATGCRVQVGHSLATPELLAEAFGCGMVGFTHLFNGMSGAHHRDAGVAAYALAHGQYAELISDLIHVNRTMMLAAIRAIPRLFAITDATASAGLPDGRYASSDDSAVIKTGLMVMTEDGTSLAGSAITMLDAYRNLVSLGLSPGFASELCATRQADYLGLRDLGRLSPGMSASFVMLGQRDLSLQGVWMRGTQT